MFGTISFNFFHQKKKKKRNSIRLDITFFLLLLIVSVFLFFFFFFFFFLLWIFSFYRSWWEKIINGGIITHRYKKYNTLYSFLESKILKVCERKMDRRMRMEIAILTHKLFSWPYHAVLSSRPHSTLLLLLVREVLNWGPAVGRCPSGAPCHSLLSATDQIFSGPKVRLTDWDPHSDSQYITWASTYIIAVHPHISVKARDCLRLFTQVRPVQRILVKTQYTT